MKILIAEDDLASRKFMQKFLSQFGECDVAVDGLEAIDAILTSMKQLKGYDLICLDIMMPKLDGLKVLKTLREIEVQNGLSEAQCAKVIMTTALNDPKTVKEAYDRGCQAYALKPIDVQKFKEVMTKLKLC